MATALTTFIAQLRKDLDGDRRAPLPDVDEKDLGDGRDVAYVAPRRVACCAHDKSRN